MLATQAFSDEVNVSRAIDNYMEASRKDLRDVSASGLLAQPMQAACGLHMRPRVGSCCTDATRMQTCLLCPTARCLASGQGRATRGGAKLPNMMWSKGTPNLLHPLNSTSVPPGRTLTLPAGRCTGAPTATGATSQDSQGEGSYATANASGLCVRLVPSSAAGPTAYAKPINLLFPPQVPHGARHDNTATVRHCAVSGSVLVRVGFRGGDPLPP